MNDIESTVVVIFHPRLLQLPRQGFRRRANWRIQWTHNAPSCRVRRSLYAHRICCDVGRHFIHRWNFTLAAKRSSRCPLIPTIATPWMWQYALRNPMDESMRQDTIESSSRASVSFRMPSRSSSSGKSQAIGAGESKSSEIIGANRVDNTSQHSDSLDSAVSSIGFQSGSSMLNKLNTKVRFMSMLRSSGNSQDVGALSKCDFRGSETVEKCTI